MNCSTPGLPVHHQLPEFTQTSCPSSQWCHPAILSSVVPFSSCLQSFPASGSFQMSQLFTSGGQSIGGSASTSVLPMNSQDWFPLGLTDWISLLSREPSRVYSSTIVWKHQFLVTQPSLRSSSHICTWLLEKPQLWLYRPLSVKWCLCFLIMLSRFVIAFLLRSRHLLISWQQSLSTVILEPRKIKSLTVCIVSPSICHEMIRQDAMIF